MAMDRTHSLCSDQIVGTEQISPKMPELMQGSAANDIGEQVGVRTHPSAWKGLVRKLSIAMESSWLACRIPAKLVILGATIYNLLNIKTHDKQKSFRFIRFHLPLFS